MILQTGTINLGSPCVLLDLKPLKFFQLQTYEKKIHLNWNTISHKMWDESADVENCDTIKRFVEFITGEIHLYKTIYKDLIPVLRDGDKARESETKRLPSDNGAFACGRVMSLSVLWYKWNKGHSTSLVTT